MDVIIDSCELDKSFWLLEMFIVGAKRLRVGLVDVIQGAARPFTTRPPALKLSQVLPLMELPRCVLRDSPRSQYLAGRSLEWEEKEEDKECGDVTRRM